MPIGLPIESAAGQTRAFASPETAKKLEARGHWAKLRRGAGLAACLIDGACPAVDTKITDRPRGAATALNT